MLIFDPLILGLIDPNFCLILLQNGMILSENQFLTFKTKRKALRIHPQHFHDLCGKMIKLWPKNYLKT